MDEIWERAVQTALDGVSDCASARTLTLDGAVKCVHGRLPPPSLLEKFHNLQHLSIANTGVSSLEQFPRLRNLQKLILSDNRIAGGLEYLVEAGLESLRDLDLSNNRIQYIEDLAPLADLRLVSLDLYECPVTRVKDYRARVFGLIKSLKYLDKMDAEENERPESDDEDDEEEEEDEDPGSGEIDGEDRSYGLNSGHSSGGEGIVEVDEDEESDAEEETETSGRRENGLHHQSNGFRVSVAGEEGGREEDYEEEGDDDDDNESAEEIYEEGEDEDVVEVHEIEDSDDEDDDEYDEDDEDEEDEVEEVDNEDVDISEPASTGGLKSTEGEIDGHEQGEDDGDEDDNGVTGEEEQGLDEDCDFEEDAADEEEEDNGAGYLVQRVVQVEDQPTMVDDQPSSPLTEFESVGAEDQHSDEDQPSSPLMEFETIGVEDQPSSPLTEFVGIEDQPTMVDVEYNNGDDKFGAKPTDKTLNLKSDDFGNLNLDGRIVNQLNRPSTAPALGSKGTLRHQNRVRLQYLLNKLVSRRNWADAGGVLSVLLKGTCNERSLHNNHIKYSVAIEIIGHVESSRAYSKDIEDIYNLWMKKIVPKTNRPWKDKFVLFDSIVSFLVRKNYDGARSCALCLRQDREVDNDPISNLMLGLCYYELWYTTLPEDRQLIDKHEQEMLGETVESGTQLYNFVANSEGYRAVSVQDRNSSFKYLSETSVMNDKVIQMDNVNRKDSVAYADTQRVEKNDQSQVQGLYIKSDQMSGSEGGSLMKRNTKMQCSSAISSHGVPDSLLFPIRWDPLNENIEDVLKELQPNDDYKDAVEYLRKALNFTPGVAAALLPLVQILLLNDRVKEALDELEKFSYASKALFASRLKTHYFECLGCNNHEQLCSSYEDILKKDPTCRHALTKLVRAYQMGDYDPDRLLEMIALHLDAAFADHDIWREFASCLLKVSQCEDDRVSTCLNGGSGEICYQNKKIPTMFFKGVLGKNWKMRCKWWLNRHFSKKLLASEMAGGDLSLMAYKAACATQIYGPGFYYVVKVGAFLKEEKNPLFVVLNMYVQSSRSGFFPGLCGGSKGLMSSWEDVFNCVRKEEEEKKAEKEGGGGQDKSVRKRGRPKAEEKGGRKRGRPRKGEKHELDGGRVNEAECGGLVGST